MNQLIKHPHYKHLKWYLIFLLIPFIGSCTPAMRATYSMTKGESAQFDAKNINEALEYYERAILEDPNHARAYARAGWLWYESKKNSDKAIDYFGKALSINDSLGKDKFLYIYKGLWGAYYRKNNWRETVNYGKKALEVNPNEKDTPHVLNGIGYSLMNLGDFQSALKYFHQAINKNKAYKIGYQRVVQSFGRSRQVQYPPKIMVYLRTQSFPVAVKTSAGQRAAILAMIRFPVLLIDFAYILFPREFP